jgi:hypothetical protein
MSAVIWQHWRGWSNGWRKCYRIKGWFTPLAPCADLLFRPRFAELLKISGFVITVRAMSSDEIFPPEIYCEILEYATWRVKWCARRVNRTWRELVGRAPCPTYEIISAAMSSGEPCDFVEEMFNLELWEREWEFHEAFRCGRFDEVMRLREWWDRLSPNVRTEVAVKFGRMDWLFKLGIEFEGLGEKIYRLAVINSRVDILKMFPPGRVAGIGNIAGQYSSIEMIDYLVERCGVDRAAVAHCAIINGRADVLTHLLQKGLQLDFEWSSAALGSGCPEILAHFVEVFGFDRFSTIGSLFTFSFFTKGAFLWCCQRNWFDRPEWQHNVKFFTFGMREIASHGDTALLEKLYEVAARCGVDLRNKFKKLPYDRAACGGVEILGRLYEARGRDEVNFEDIANTKELKVVRWFFDHGMFSGVKFCPWIGQQHTCFSPRRQHEVRRIRRFLTENNLLRN